MFNITAVLEDYVEFQAGEAFKKENEASYVLVKGSELEANKVALDSYFKSHADHTLILDVGGGPHVNHRGELSLYTIHMPQEVRHLVIADTSYSVTSVGDYFLSYDEEDYEDPEVSLENLTSIDLVGLRKVSSIGDDFLRYCSGLTFLDLSPLTNLTSIGHWFLCGCSGLTSLDLSSLINLISIERGFLYGCKGLSALDLIPLSNVDSIGGDFLSKCSGLTSLDLSPLRNVAYIGHRFLCRCTGLPPMDLRGLSIATPPRTRYLSYGGPSVF